MPDLIPHPDNPTSPLRLVAASARRTAAGGLAVVYLLQGDVERLRIPPPRPPRIGYRLWRHTCCEVFIAADASPGYYEFNLSPSGEWIAHAFTTYRDGRTLRDEALNPQIAVQRGAGSLELSALIDLKRLGVLEKIQGKMRVGLSVVAEHEDGGLSYWALKHAPGKPDFHHRDAFALEIDEARP